MSDLIINGKNFAQPEYINTGARFIPTLAFAYHSKQCCKKTLKHYLPASKEGHHELLNQADEANMFLSSSIGAVGDALASDEDMNSETIRNLGFLIYGLSDLQSLVNNTQNVINQSLRSINSAGE